MDKSITRAERGVLPTHEYVAAREMLLHLYEEQAEDGSDDSEDEDSSSSDDDDDLDFENFGEDSVSKHREKLLQKQAQAKEEKKAAMTPDNAASPNGGQWSDPLAALEDG